MVMKMATEKKTSSKEVPVAQNCLYCGVELVSGRVQQHGPETATRDHIYPKSKGGRTVVQCCEWCNFKKANKPVGEWLASESLAGRRAAVLATAGAIKPVEDGRVMAIYEHAVGLAVLRAQRAQIRRRKWLRTK